MIRLAIDCADKAVSCAIVRAGTLLAESFLKSGQTHSQTLMPQIEQALAEAGLSLQQVDELAVSCGPGSFTGLRIGIAAVKGLAFAGGKPCRGVSTLHAIATAAGNFEGTVCAVMDARCSQVYNALFSCSGGVLQRLCDDRALMIDELGRELLSVDEPILLIGPGAEICYNKLCEQIGSLSVLSSDPCARYVAAVADEYAAVEGAALAPSYLRLPQAERELKAKQQKLSGGDKI